MENDIPTKQMGDSSQLERIIMERVKVGIAKDFAGHSLNSMDVHLVANALIEGFTAYAKMELLSETVGEYGKTVRFRSPKSWWQMLKAQYFPAWWLRAWPIKTKVQEETVVFTVKAVYPKLEKEPRYYIHELNKVEGAEYES